MLRILSPKPLVCVIASVSLDHTKVLGSTIPEIAAEKAGILKSGCPVVMAHNRPEAAQVIRARAQELYCPLYEADGLSCEVLRSDETGISTVAGIFWRKPPCAEIIRFRI